MGNNTDYYPMYIGENYVGLDEGSPHPTIYNILRDKSQVGKYWLFVMVF